MECCVVIPARGGSKRLPRKNVRLLCGRPLLAYSIAYARKEAPSARIVVSTDDEEIAQIGTRFGAEALMRPAALALDTSPTGPVLKHILEQIEEELPVVLLQPTSPLRPTGLISEGLKRLAADSRATSVVSVSMLHGKLGQITDERYRPVGYSPGARSQDLPPYCTENGLFFATRYEIAREGEVFGTEIAPLVVSSSIPLPDIDTAEDFAFAERLLRAFPEEFSYVEEYL